jgi:hypothetical protein
MSASSRGEQNDKTQGLSKAITVTEEIPCILWNSKVYYTACFSTEQDKSSPCPPIPFL